MKPRKPESDRKKNIQRGDLTFIFDICKVYCLNICI